MKERILWISNKSYIQDCEVNEVIKCGKSVFFPKISEFSNDIKISNQYDSSLELPEDIMDQLNETDFFSDYIGDTKFKLLNNYFKYMILEIDSSLLKEAVVKFKGIIIIRIKASKGANEVVQFLEEKYGFWLIKQLEKIKNRVALCSDTKVKKVYNMLFTKQNSYYTPNVIPSINNVEVKKKNAQILYLCPHIRTDKTCEKLKDKFKTAFANVPHAIIGDQIIDVVNDKSMINIHTYNEYIEYFSQYTALYVDLPGDFEVPTALFLALSMNIPIIYQNGSIVDRYFNKSTTGKCSTISEAIKKCKMLLHTSESFSKKILKDQDLIKRSMKKQIDDSWKAIFSHYSDYNNYESDVRKKIAFIIPGICDDYYLNYTITLIKAISLGAKANNSNIDLVLGCIEQDYKAVKKYEDELNELNIPIRIYSWEIVRGKRVKEAVELQGYKLQYYKDTYGLINDGISYFEDCDCIIYTDNQLSITPYSIRPYATILHNYAQRYTPELFSKLNVHGIELERNAYINYSSQISSHNDYIQYIGGNKNVKDLPLFFESIEPVDTQLSIVQTSDYFVWNVDLDSYIDYEPTLSAIADYYVRGGNTRCYIIGTDRKTIIKSLNEKECTGNVKGFINLVKSNSLYMKQIKIIGKYDKELNLNIIRKSKFLLNPIYTHDCCEYVANARMLGTPVLTIKYPELSFIDETYSLNLKYYKKNDKKDLIQSLFEMESISKNQQVDLSNLTIQNKELCIQIYNQMIEYLPL